jgi:VWFA-related protein
MSARKGSTVVAILVIAVLLLLGAAYSQSSGQQPIPDAPSATRPFPKPNVSPTAPPAAPEGSQESADASNQPEAAPPTPEITTVPEGTPLPPSNTNSRNELYTLTFNTNFVQVPVTVRDDNGQLVAGLLPKDFNILENNESQRIAFFTSDPFPLSAAVVLDLGMSDVAVNRVRETLPALVGAFGQFDEVALYTYGNTVRKVQGFAPAQNDVIVQTIRTLQKNVTGRTGGVPTTSGPMMSGPSVNGRPYDQGATATVNSQQSTDFYRPTSRVLNDAILQAALDLAQRDRGRRKVLFVISNGREYRSDASYSEVLKVLQTNQITFYGVGVEEAAIPGYSQLNRARIPGQGYGDVLPKYAAATGGLVFNEFNRDAIETAYAQVTQTARNQYTIGYYTKNSASSQYRSIEVRVRKPGLKVLARDGYYPLPPRPR